jgi:hypothetical protein
VTKEGLLSTSLILEAIETKDCLLSSSLLQGGYREHGIVCCQHLCHWEVREARDGLLPTCLPLGGYRDKDGLLTTLTLGGHGIKGWSAAYISDIGRL